MRRILYSVIIILSFFPGKVLFSQSVEDLLRLSSPGIPGNARTLGMGNSFISVSDDAEAAVFNPAGLALVRKMEVSGGIDYQKYSNSTTFMNQLSSNSNSKTDLGQFAFVLPFPTYRGSFAIGLSYNQSKNFSGALKFDGFNSNSTYISHLAAYGSGSDLDRLYNLYLSSSGGSTALQNRLRQYGTVLDDGLLSSWDLSASLEVERNLYVGVSLGIKSGSYTSDFVMNEEDSRGLYTNVAADPTDPLYTTGFMKWRYQSNLKWDITGIAFKVGLLYQLDHYGRFGATVTFPKTYTVKEDYSTIAQSQFTSGAPQPYVTDPYHQEYDITTPYEFAVGGSLNMSGLLVSADVTYIDYTQSEIGNASKLYDSDVSNINTDAKTYLHDVFNYNLGAEYTFPTAGLRLRAGYFAQQSPYAGDPSSYNRKYVTGGLGFLIENSVTVDLALAHGTWKSIGDNYGSNESRTYQDITDNKFIVSFSYRF